MAKKSRFFRRHRKKWSKIKNILDFSEFHIYLFKRKSAPLNNLYRAALGVGSIGGNAKKLKLVLKIQNG